MSGSVSASSSSSTSAVYVDSMPASTERGVLPPTPTIDNEVDAVATEAIKQSKGQKRRAQMKARIAAGADGRTMEIATGAGVAPAKGDGAGAPKPVSKTEATADAVAGEAFKKNKQQRHNEARRAAFKAKTKVKMVKVESVDGMAMHEAGASGIAPAKKVGSTSKGDPLAALERMKGFLDTTGAMLTQISESTKQLQMRSKELLALAKDGIPDAQEKREEILKTLLGGAGVADSDEFSSLYHQMRSIKETGTVFDVRTKTVVPVVELPSDSEP